MYSLSGSWFSLMYDSVRTGSLDSSKALIIARIQQQYHCSYSEACERFSRALHVMAS
ncbi:MAG TPA: hypothetical protein VNX25_02300 [Verrucomicrobiae bacterium]|nr:hypothetical protein [Verrucomicrobiae bacterium]